MAERVQIPERIVRRRVALWSRMKARWAFYVWVLAIGAAVLMYSHGGEFGGMSGTVEALHEDLAPLETARLLSLDAEVGQPVRAGDVVARMDTSVLDAELAVERLQAERQFAAAVSRAETELQDARIRQASEAAEAEVLDAELKRLDALLERGLVDAQTVSEIRARRQALVRAQEMYPELVRGLEEEVERSRVRMGAVRDHMGSSGARAEGDPELAASRERLGLLNMRREAYTLRARCGGTVSAVYQQPGNVVLEGTPIVTIVAAGPRRVVGYLPESNAMAVREGQEAYVSRAAGGFGAVRAKVMAMMPEVAALPMRISPFPDRVYRGRRVMLELVEPNDFLPGESVSIRLSRPWLTRLVSLLFPGEKPGS